ncbi:MAG TPA: fumarylacetoacetate hydrolase family protein, partial [Rhizomicrobium sp.]|nr:fumarylacetoacetate hydrolase family protein [Rhizomicrobium sp.]
MKLATFETDGRERVGLVAGDAIIDLAQAAPRLSEDMIALIEAWPSVEAELRRIESVKPHFKIADVRLKAPVPRPQKILAIGLNYADHIAESGQKTPERQIWFSKLPNAVNGPYDPIQMPKASSAIDYEAEFVAIIGKRCRHVSKADAPGVIFGYAAGNDVSVRDWQFHTPQWILGKSFDTHAPFGPWIVTPDEI